MDSSKSISQGTFLTLPPSFSLAKLRRGKKRKAEVEETTEVWETAFLNVWNSIDKELKELHEKLYSRVVEEVATYVSKVTPPCDVIPCALLLTGTNLPDHAALVTSLTRELTRRVTSHVATLWAGDASTLRVAVNALVSQLIQFPDTESNHSDDDSEADEEEDKVGGVRVGQVSLGAVAEWYGQQHPADADDSKRPPVVIIIPDFESFSPLVLSDLIALLCAYSGRVPFLLVLGVATSPSAVSQSLPLSALSRLLIQLFHSEASPTLLNHVMDRVLLSDQCPFRLGAKTFTFLTDVFLFHSFSVQRFIQGFKYCMMEHFYLKDHMSLCCAEQDLPSASALLTSSAVENLRKIPSFQRHVETCDLPERKRLLLEDTYTKEFVVNQLKSLHSHSSDFHNVLKCLHILARDLPGAPLGRHVREVYCRAVSSSIVTDPDYKQALSLAGMQARPQLSAKVAAIIDLLKIDSILDILSEEQNRFEPVLAKLEVVKKDMDRAAADPPPTTNGDVERKDPREELMSLLSAELFEAFLVPPTSLPMHELLYFDDLVAVRRRISGAPRSAIHTALNNPHHYLECSCCALPELDAVLPTLPDISIVYKLYLESNKVISLFDWLQSFGAVIKPEDTSANGGIDQTVQARFTRAVSELQFLGFIKPSKAKPDHVTRLTFGNL